MCSHQLRWSDTGQGVVLSLRCNLVVGDIIGVVQGVLMGGSVTGRTRILP